RSMIEFSGAPTRLTCAQAPHAPRWVRFQTELDCTQAYLESASKTDYRSYAPAKCSPDEPPVQVGVRGRCPAGPIDVEGALHFDDKRKVWVVSTWVGPGDWSALTICSVTCIAGLAILYVLLERERRKRGIS